MILKYHVICTPTNKNNPNVKEGWKEINEEREMHVHSKDKVIINLSDPNNFYQLECK